ncbi:hypothetical protein M3E18_01080 [Kocuria sp. p3-SID1433]|uniref:hypothetical protein n=1 Tax=unclassified Kocuria TaxID=2649579 RepID=UPI0021A3FCA3|nr:MULTISPECIES: hypothetical protein [unclassified Kocuria]MCT1600889.1 hypothetical protein [Kocuria sp. p3-SID1428]MCT2179150.1 hypothetical protein [Kocuria sp. p3-SID1433]
MAPSSRSARSQTAAARAFTAPVSQTRRKGRAEPRLLPIAVILWIVGLAAFLAGFGLGNTGSGAAMTLTFFGGLIVATIAEVGAFLTALASVISYRRHRPWNVIVMILSVLISPATLILLLQLAMGS